MLYLIVAIKFHECSLHEKVHIIYECSLHEKVHIMSVLYMKKFIL